MIHHIDAHNGSIRFYNEGLVGASNNAEGIAYILNTHGGFSEEASMSSSMHFASEDGFENDDSAMELLFVGMGLHANDMGSVI